MTPIFVTLEVVENEGRSLLSENEWVERLAAISHPLRNRWEEHQAIIQEATPAPPSGRYDVFKPSQFKTDVAAMAPTAKKTGYCLAFTKDIIVKTGDKLYVMAPKSEG